MHRGFFYNWFENLTYMYILSFRQTRKWLHLTLIANSSLLVFFFRMDTVVVFCTYRCNKRTKIRCSLMLKNIEPSMYDFTLLSENCSNEYENNNFSYLYFFSRCTIQFRSKYHELNISKLSLKKIVC